MEQQHSLDSAYFEKRNVLEAVAGTAAGIVFLQWLVGLTGFNKPSMTMEDAARRDVWLSVRRFVPVEKLSEVEHHALRQEQEQVRQMLQESGEIEQLMEGHFNE